MSESANFRQSYWPALNAFHLELNILLLGFLLSNVFKNLLLTNSTPTLEHSIHKIKTSETNNNQDPQRKYNVHTKIKMS